MGGPVIVTVRPGVRFVPDAAAAFRRAEAQVRAELGRNIDVNSTYRDYNQQLDMWNAWVAWTAGRGPHPGHSKALHPDDPLAFHTKGLALDSDDWTNDRVVQILAEHGFIRNRLDVPNEEHHFEWIRSEDKHYNDPIPQEGFLMALSDKQQKELYDRVTVLWNAQRDADKYGRKGTVTDRFDKALASIVDKLTKTLDRVTVLYDDLRDADKYGRKGTVTERIDKAIENAKRENG